MAGAITCSRRIVPKCSSASAIASTTAGSVAPSGPFESTFPLALNRTGVAGGGHKKERGKNERVFHRFLTGAGAPPGGPRRELTLMRRLRRRMAAGADIAHGRGGPPPAAN